MKAKELQIEARKAFNKYINDLTASKKAQDDYLISRMNGSSTEMKITLRERASELGDITKKSLIEWEMINKKVNELLEK